MGLKGVIFDLDLTLGNRVQYAYDMYYTVCQKYGAHIKGPFLLEAIVTKCMCWDQNGTVSRKYVLDKLAKEFNIIIPEEEFQNTYLYACCFKGVYELLSRLKEKYQVTLITNGNSITQRKKIEQMELEKYFSCIIVGGDNEFSKPDKRIFELMLTKMQLNADEVVYVGDNFYADIYGATQAGIKPIWIVDDNVKCHVDVLRTNSVLNIEKLLAKIK